MHTTSFVSVICTCVNIPPLVLQCGPYITHVGLTSEPVCLAVFQTSVVITSEPCLYILSSDINVVQPKTAVAVLRARHTAVAVLRARHTVPVLNCPIMTRHEPLTHTETVLNRCYMFRRQLRHLQRDFHKYL
jgi:hypothetical protein